MKKQLVLIMSLLVVLCVTACSKQAVNTDDSTASSVQSTQSETDDTANAETDSVSAPSEAEGKKVASDGAQMQTDDSSMPTRIIENGTRINMYFGETVIPGILNDSETAQALIAKLPYTVHVSRYSHDFCGVTDELPYNEEEVHYGWLNGDIDYAINAPYFTILFADEENSEQYGDQVNIGVIDCPLSEISSLQGSYDVRIELAE